MSMGIPLDSVDGKGLGRVEGEVLREGSVEEGQSI